MNMSFYTAAVGAAQQQQRLNVQANNIANINTHGFKAEYPSFASLMYDGITGIDNVRLPRGTGALMVMAGTDFSDGGLATTGLAQDYAIIGDGFFGLLDPASGQISYTRDGSFTLTELLEADADGVQQSVWYLSDGLGKLVLDQNAQPIAVEDAMAAQPVGVFDFVNVDGMQHIGSNQFVPVAKNGDVQRGAGTVRQGVLELSNADLAQEMSKVIEAQRSFTYALKMIQTSDEIENTINSLRG